MGFFKMKKIAYCVFVTIFISACTPLYIHTKKNDPEGTFLTTAKDVQELQSYEVVTHYNALQYAGFYYSLNSQEVNLHKKAVYFALNESADGEIIHWKNSKGNIFGKVRVIMSYPRSSGYCRIYQIYITKDSQTNYLTNKACKFAFGYHWGFVI
jgi:surface antigen